MLWEKRKDIFRIAEKDIYRMLTILDKYKKITKVKIEYVSMDIFVY